MLEQRLGTKSDAIVWPETSDGLPDKEPLFLVGYLPLEFANQSTLHQEDTAKVFLSKCGDSPRRYKNGVCLAIPDKKQMESLRRAVRYLMAIERVESKRSQHRLTKDQADLLKERKRTEDNAAEGAFRSLYAAVWLPRLESGGSIGIEKLGGKPLQATGVHERVMELLAGFSTPKVHGTVLPRKIVERVKLGEVVAAGEPSRMGISTIKVQEAFFEILEPPRISSAIVLSKAIARGVNEGAFAYTTGSPSLGPDGKYLLAPSKVTTSQMSEDEVDLDDGFLIAPAAVPVVAPLPGTAPTLSAPGSTALSPGAVPSEPTTTPGATVRTTVHIQYAATRDQVFKSFQALANLADKSDGGKINIQVDGVAAAGYDQNWLRNAVEEPLDEANIDGMDIK
jgi:hypothetical protein